MLREGGQEPQSQSVEKTIAFLTANELLPDERVREYLLQSSERFFNDYFIVQRLLGAIIPLVQLGFSDQAAQIYKKLARYDDPRIWYSGRVWGASIIAKTLFTTVLGFDRLLIDGPETWGAIAVSLIDRFLLEAQRSEWPDWVKRHNALADSFGGELLDEGAFQPRYDDPLRSYHYRFDRDQRRGTPHVLVASTIEKAAPRSLPGRHRNGLLETRRSPHQEQMVPGNFAPVAGALRESQVRPRQALACRGSRATPHATAS